MDFTLLPHTLNDAEPLIYMWKIRGTDGALLGRYVGKAKGGAGRPLKQYARNVANIVAGKAYRKGKPSVPNYLPGTR